MLRVPNVLVMNAETAQRLNITQPGRPDRLRQGQPGQAQLRLGRQRQRRPPGGRDCSSSQAGIFAVHIPYNGGNPAQLACCRARWTSTRQPGHRRANIRAGKLKALAVTTAQRSSVMPDVPTMAETLPGFEIDTWWGLVAPAGTPRTRWCPAQRRVHRGAAARPRSRRVLPT
jgi:hypothetical protein